MFDLFHLYFYYLFTDCGHGCKTCVSGVCSECNEGLVFGRKSRRCVKACSRADPNNKAQACEGKRKGKERKKNGKGKLTALTYKNVEQNTCSRQDFSTFLALSSVTFSLLINFFFRLNHSLYSTSPGFDVNIF